MTNQRLYTVPQELVAQNKSHCVHHDWQKPLRSGPSLPLLIIPQQASSYTSATSNVPKLPEHLPPQLCPLWTVTQLAAVGLCLYILNRSPSQSLLGLLPKVEWRGLFPDYSLENGFLPMSLYSPIQLVCLFIIYHCVHSSSFFSKLTRKSYHSALVCRKTQEPPGHWLQEEK